MQARYRSEEVASRLSEIAPTHWNSRLFTAQIAEDLQLGFWQSENALHGKPVAIEGDLSAAGMRFAIVMARWNAVITDRLLQGSLDGLHRSGAAKDDVQIVRVPGAWEIPSAARTLAESKKYDAIITLGCLLRGETAHYEAIYTEVARGIGQSQQETGVPHAFGVLTCETLEQALDRAGVKAGNKGFEAAIAAIEMVSIQRKLAAQDQSSDEGGGVMGTRRKSRELTMQMLFQGDLGKQNPDEVRKLFWASREDVDQETRGFAEDLHRVASSRQAEIDASDRAALAELAAGADAGGGPESAAGGDRGDAGVPEYAGADHDQREPGGGAAVCGAGVDSLPERGARCGGAGSFEAAVGVDFFVFLSGTEKRKRAGEFGAENRLDSPAFSVGFGG